MSNRNCPVDRTMFKRWRSMACAALTGMALAAAVSPAGATDYIGQGKIGAIYTWDSSRSDVTHVMVTGFTSAGTCQTSDGMVMMVLRNDYSGRNHLAAALAAKASNTTVYVRVSDTLKIGSACVLWLLQWQP